MMNAQSLLPARSQCGIITCFALLFFVGAMMTSCSSSIRFASQYSGESRTNTGTAAKSPPTKSSGKESSASGFAATGEVFTGGASYYGNEFQGRKTSSGERYDKNEFSAAHRTLPFGTMLRIRNLANNRSVIVRVNDRGPWKETRVLDLSYAAAEELGMTRSGTAQIEATVLQSDMASGKP